MAIMNNCIVTDFYYSNIIVKKGVMLLQHKWRILSPGKVIMPGGPRIFVSNFKLRALYFSSSINFWLFFYLTVDPSIC